MVTQVHDDPFAGLGRRERRALRAAERRACRDHDQDQLTELRSMAATGSSLTRIDGQAEDTDAGTAPLEVVLEGRRVRLGRVSRRAASALRDGLGSPLTRAHRYGPYWVLTFRLRTEQLVLLAEHLTLLPDWHGGGGFGAAVPKGPLALQGA